MGYTLFENLQLVAPYLIMGLEGDSNAANVVTTAIRHLHNYHNPTRIGGIEKKSYYIDTLNPPRGKIIKGDVRLLGSASINVHLCNNPNKPKNDLVLLSGDEPGDRWEECALDIVRLSKELGVRKLFAIGSYEMDVPHTRPVPIKATFSNPRLRRFLEKRGVGVAPNYEGPLSFNHVLLAAATYRRLDAVGLEVGVPEYLEMLDQPTYYRGCQAVLETLEKLLGMDLKSRELIDDVIAEGEGIDRIVNVLPDQEIEIRLNLREHLAELERAYDERRRPRGLVDRQLEEILRKKRTRKIV